VGFDVILISLKGLNLYKVRIQQIICFSATAGLIVLLSFPVAFVGVVANISALAK
jgi:ABC-type Fe3+-siderophore transport system permease subunit